MPVLLSSCLAAGLLLIFLSVTSRRQPSADGGRSGSRAGRFAPLLGRSRAGAASDRQLPLLSGLTALVIAVVVQGLLGWPVLSIAAGAVGLLLPSWHRRQRAERRRDAVEEAVAEAVDALRDAVRVGIGIEESLRALARTGPLALRPAFAALARDARVAGTEEALGRARERVAHPAFDTLVAALLLSYRIGGHHLSTVLDGLSRSVRGAARARREVRAAQAQQVLSARVIAALPLLLIVAIRATNPGYLAVFSTPGGQVVLAVCLVSVAVGYAGMVRATALPGQERVLR